MEFRNLGQSGLRVSAIGLGCNNFGGRIDAAATKAVLHAAFDAGITLFDTADVYGNRGGSETLMGEMLGDMRHSIVLATKFCMPMGDTESLKGGSRRYIISAVEASLKRLRTDHIDLYQMHRMDPLTPIDESLRALSDLVTQGKIRYFGCSNFSAWRLVEAQWTARSLNLPGFVSAQDEYSLINRGHEKDLIPVLNTYGLGLLPYYPLANGLLTGKYRRNQPMPEGARISYTPRLVENYLTDRNWAIAEQLTDYAEARGHTVLELAFSWLLAQRAVSSVIAGATKPEQIAQNVVAGAWKLTESELSEIGAIAAS